MKRTQSNLARLSFRSIKHSLHLMLIICALGVGSACVAEEPDADQNTLPTEIGAFSLAGGTDIESLTQQEVSEVFALIHSYLEAGGARSQILSVDLEHGLVSPHGNGDPNSSDYSNLACTAEFATARSVVFGSYCKCKMPNGSGFIAYEEGPGDKLEKGDDCASACDLICNPPAKMEEAEPLATVTSGGIQSSPIE